MQSIVTKLTDVGMPSVIPLKALKNIPPPETQNLSRIIAGYLLTCAQTHT